MEFTPDITAFQGAIMSVDNVHSFSDLGIKGGNEEKIEYLVSNLKKFLTERGCLDNNGAIKNPEMMRKHTLFLVLNADLFALAQMANHEGVDSVVWAIPTIPKFLLSELVWNLNIEQFVYEIIVFTYPPLSLEVAHAILSNLKYFSPSESLHKLKIIGTACYHSLCRLNFFNFENTETSSQMLLYAFNNFNQCMNYFTAPPNAWKLNNLSKDDTYKFKGKCLLTMLNLIQECMQHFTKKQDFAIDGFDEIYQATYLPGSRKDILSYNICDSSRPLIDCIDKCNDAMLDKFKELVMDISVVIFCAWSEFEENGTNMQEIIGKKCYRLREQLLSIPSVADHIVISMIKQISRKPVDMQHIVNSADTATIIDNLNKGGDVTAMWARALINKDKLCHDVVLVQHFAQHVNLLNEEDSLKLYNVCANHLKEHPGNADVEMLSVKAFNHCTTPEKFKILEQRFVDKTLFDMTITTIFEDSMTEMFNRFISNDNVELTNVLSLFLQSPQKIFHKIFQLATKSKAQMEIMLKIITLLKPFSNHYYKIDTEPCVVRVAHSVLEKCIAGTEDMQDNLVKFMTGLKDADIIPGSKLLMLIVMPNLHKGLLSKSIVTINVQCKLLTQSFDREELVLYRAPLLAMLAQVLDVLRWRINTYVSEGPSTLELTLELQNYLMRTYDVAIPANEANWLRSKLRCSQPMNMFYYKKLWGLPSDNFVEVVSGKKVHSAMSTEQLTIWLSQVLCVTAEKEWFDIWDCLSCFTEFKTLDIIHDALALVTLTEAVNRSEQTWDCLCYCLRNFAHLIIHKFFRDPLSEAHITAAVEKITTTANIMKDDNNEDIFLAFLPFFLYMVTQKREYKQTVVSLLNSKLNNPKFLEMTSNLMTAEPDDI